MINVGHNYVTWERPTRLEQRGEIQLLKNAIAILDRVVTDSDEPQYMPLHLMRLRFGSEIRGMILRGWRGK